MEEGGEKGGRRRRARKMEEGGGGWSMEAADGILPELAFRLFIAGLFRSGEITSYRFGSSPIPDEYGGVTLRIRHRRKSTHAGAGWNLPLDSRR